MCIKKNVSIALILLFLTAGLVAADYELQYKCQDTDPGSEQIQPHFNIINNSGNSVNMSGFQIRYYYTKEGSAPEQFWCDYAEVGSTYVSGGFHDGYIELNFAAGAGSIPAGGESGQIQARFAKTDRSAYNQADDYSFDPSITVFTAYGRSDLLLNGVVVPGSITDPVPDLSAGLSISLPQQSVDINDPVRADVYLNSGEQLVAAYGFDVTYDPGYISIDTSLGTEGVSAGADGFVTAVNANIPGLLAISGFNVTGTGPGNNLHLLSINLVPVTAGTSSLELAVNNLVDENYNPIPVPFQQVTTGDFHILHVDSWPPTISPTPVDDTTLTTTCPCAGDYRILPAEQSVQTGDPVITEIHVNTGNQIIAAYGFDILYDHGILSVNTSIGTNGVEPGAEGFVTAVNPIVPGSLVVSGFDIQGKGPGADLHLLTVHFIADTPGTSVLSMQINNSIDNDYITIGMPTVTDAAVTVLPEEEFTSTPLILEPVTDVYQAEEGAWENAVVQDEHSGYTGTGYVNTDNNQGNWIEFTVELASAATVTLDFFYANGSTANRRANVTINSSSENPGLDFAYTGAWDRWSGSSMDTVLEQGSHKIRITANTTGGLPNVDRLEVSYDRTRPDPVEWTLTIHPGAFGIVRVNPPDEQVEETRSFTYPAGTIVQLQAVWDSYIPGPPSHPDCGIYIDFKQWEGDWEGDIFSDRGSIIINSDKTVTAVYNDYPVPCQPTPTPPAPGVIISLPGRNIIVNDPVQADVYLNSGNHIVAAYGFDVTYDPAFMSINTSLGTGLGTGGVSAGADGFVTVVNGDTPGLLAITGFDISGKGPGNNLHFLSINLIPVAEGTTSLDLAVNNLTDINYHSIPIPYTRVSTGNINIVPVDPTPTSEVPTSTPTPEPTATPVITTSIFQAEDGDWHNASVDDDHQGYTGSGYVNTVNAAGNWIEFTVDLPRAGLAELVFYYANGSSTNRTAAVTVNNSTVNPALDFEYTGGWPDWQSSGMETSLGSGITRIRITGNTSEGLPNVDKLEVSCDNTGPAPSEWTLTIQLGDDGRIRVNPPDEQIEETASFTYPADTIVQLEALDYTVPGSVYPDCGADITFQQWEGDWEGDTASAGGSITMDSDKTVTAVYTVYPVPCPTPTPTPGILPTITYQAEDGEWNNAIVESEHRGHTGSGYVNTENTAGNWIEFSVEITAASSRKLVFTYANGSSRNRTATVTVNGSVVNPALDFTTTGSWTDWRTSGMTVELNAGPAAIRITANTSEGLPNIDKLELDSISPPVLPTPGVTPTPAPTPAPTPVLTEPTSLPGPDPGNVSILPAEQSADNGSSVPVSIYVNTGNQNLAAYGITVLYDPDILAISGQSNVVAGADGYVSAVNAAAAGEIAITGFHVNGIGPGGSLELCVIYFTAVGSGTSPIDLVVNNLIDSNYNDVGSPMGQGGSVSVLCCSPPPTITPSPTPAATLTAGTPTPMPGAGIVSMLPANQTMEVGEEMRVSFYVNTGNQKLAAYGVDVLYNSSILVVASLEAGADGYVSATSPGTPGRVIVSGFDVNGTGPGSALELFVITFYAAAPGTAAIDVVVNNLSDENYNNVGSCLGVGGIIAVSGSIIPTNPPPTPTAIPTPSGIVHLLPANQTVNVGDSFTTNVRVDTGSQNLAAYRIDILFAAHVMAVDRSIGMEGVTAGSEGYVTAVNASVPGELLMTGFDNYGSGPSADLDLLVINWKAIGGGVSALDYGRITLYDVSTDKYINPSGVTARVTVTGPTIEPTSIPTPTPETTPTPEPTPTTIPTPTAIPTEPPPPTVAPTDHPAAGEIRMVPANKIVTINDVFTVQIHINTGDQLLAAYGLDLLYDVSILSVLNIEAGAQGFLSATCSDFGVNCVSGFDVSGVGPGVNLELLDVTFRAVNTGASRIRINVQTLTDPYYTEIGTPVGIGGIITVTEPLPSSPDLAGRVSCLPENATATVGDIIPVSFCVNSGSQLVAAYGIDVNYNPAILAADWTAFHSGAEGYITAFDSSFPGVIVVTGFDVNGTGPGSCLELFVVNFTAIGPGTANIDITVNSLVDVSYTDVGTPAGIDGTITVIAPPTPTPEAPPVEPPVTPAPPAAGAGEVTMLPANQTAEVGDEVTVGIYVNSGDRMLAAYGMEISYDTSVLSTSEGDVVAGADGFVSASAISYTDGMIPVTGFDVSGTGPGTSLELLIITFTAVGSGTSNIDISVNSLIDTDYQTIGIPAGIGGSITVTGQATPVPPVEPTETPPPQIPVTGPGTVSIIPALQTVLQGNTFTTEVHLDSGNDRIAAYGLDLNFDTAIVIPETGTGSYGVTAGSNGYVSAVNLVGNTLIISGFDISGTGPGADLHLITVEWNALTRGSTAIDIVINNLITPLYNTIGTPQSNGSMVIVE